MRHRLDQLVRTALGRVAADTGLAELADFDPGIERARDVQHGDFASNVAMRAAKPVGRAPRELAALIVAALGDDPILARAEVAGPGFINFRLAASAYHETLRAILAQQSRYGTAP
ncbi:MAG: arginine--tRNA ligase, partial [Gammaproteobacteria bacterium]|nr:arginine--tRNA ligase [Gammaproteobacteria bacterium]